jgi:hypothetical protein
LSEKLPHGILIPRKKLFKNGLLRDLLLIE